MTKHTIMPTGDESDFDLVQSTVDKAQDGDTIQLCALNQQGELCGWNLAPKAESGYEFKLKCPRPNASGNNQIDLKQFLDDQNTNYNIIAELQYKLLSVDKSLNFIGENIDGDVTQLDFSELDEIGDITMMSGFVCHNGKSCTFRDLKFNNGLPAIWSFGAPVNVSNCSFVRCRVGLYIYQDDKLAQTEEGLDIVPTTITDCSFFECGNYFRIVGGGALVTKTQFGPPNAALHDKTSSGLSGTVDGTMISIASLGDLLNGLPSFGPEFKDMLTCKMARGVDVSGCKFDWSSVPRDKMEFDTLFQTTNYGYHIKDIKIHDNEFNGISHRRRRVLMSLD
jgi:hypothetical protein